MSDELAAMDRDSGQAAGGVKTVKKSGSEGSTVEYVGIDERTSMEYE